MTPSPTSEVVWRCQCSLIWASVYIFINQMLEMWGLNNYKNFLGKSKTKETKCTESKKQPVKRLENKKWIIENQTEFIQIEVSMEQVRSFCIFQGVTI